MLLLGIDPGVRSGFCLMDGVNLLDYWETESGLDGFLDWFSAANFEGVDEVVCEDFIRREGKNGVDTTPLLVIGAVRMAGVFTGTPVHMRAPSGRIAQVPDSVLKSLGLYLSGKENRNAKEAIRHCVARLKSMGNKEVIQAYV